MTNPFRNRGASEPSGQHTGAPTNVDDYVQWLNRLERRPGRWAVVSKEGTRQVEYLQERGTSEWLADQGIKPRIGINAR